MFDEAQLEQARTRFAAALRAVVDRLAVGKVLIEFSPPAPPIASDEIKAFKTTLSTWTDREYFLDFHMSPWQLISFHDEALLAAVEFYCQKLIRGVNHPVGLVTM